MSLSLEVGMVRWPSWILVPVSVVLALVVSGAILVLGLKVRGSGFVNPLPMDRAPDYGRTGFRSFPQLSAGYISKILSGTLTGAGSRTSAVNPLAAATRGGSRSPGRVVLAHDATNDDWADSVQIPSLPFTANTNTSKATREAGEPSECAPAGGSVWYRYNAPRDMALIANTFESRYSTSLGVFTGTRLGDLRSVGCDTDAQGASIVGFAAKAETVYYFQITGPVGGGELVFTLEPPGHMTRASLSSSGDEANSDSGAPLSVSGDGRYATFASFATNLVAGFGETRCGSAESEYVNWRDRGGRCPAVFLRDQLSGRTIPVSVSSSGVKANDASWNSSISANGRYVAFESLASNLVSGDTNGVWDVFVRDLIAGTTERVSVSYTGGQASDPTGFVRASLTSGSGNGAISADGRFVAFNSWADNLVPGDTPGMDIFVRDRLSQTTEIVSVSSSGQNGEGMNDAPSISFDGRYVAFQSFDSTLVPGDRNEKGDVLVHDRLQRSTVRASVSSSGTEGDNESFSSVNEGPGISGDGRYVAFYSWATNLVEGDNNNTIDVFVHDLSTKTTVRASVSSSGQETSFPDPVGRGFAFARMSHDGRYVSFASNAPNLVPGKTDTIVDVFIHDLHTRTTLRVSTSPTGEAGNGDSSFAYISPDGASVAFSSSSSNFVSDDTNDKSDVFMFKRPEDS